MSGFVHLHNHSEYSLLDGMTRPEEMAEIASSSGQFATAVTDHGTMGSFVRFQKACDAQGVKPVFGVEAYFVDDVNNDDMDEKAERFHLILLAKNDEGLKNLFRLNKVAWLDQFYYKPRIDFPSLQAHSEGLICLSGCMGGAIAQAILNDNEERAEYLLKRHHEMFGDDFYIEVQAWNDQKLNDALIGYSDSMDIPLVATADCHYPTKEHAGVEEVMLCSGMKPSFNAPTNRYAKEHRDEANCEHDLQKKMNILYPDRRLNFENYPLYMMTHDEISGLFKEAGYERDDMFDNTIEIAEKCDARLKFGGVLIPDYTKEAKIKMSSADYLHELAFMGLEEKGLLTDEYKERLEYELSILNGKGFADYFLILWDFVTWCDNNGIRRGTGRGSSCGCLVAYALNITRIDPIVHGLLFFRFLNPERNDYPDIDLDIEDKRRDEAKQYLRDRWGDERVAGIATYGKFKAKSVIKSIASVFQVEFNEANSATQKFETFDEYLSKKELAAFRDKWPDIEVVADKLLGRYQQTGAHAAGLVICSQPLDEVCPVEARVEAETKRRIPVIAFDGEEVAELGLIKNDPLSLKAIAVIGDCVDAIKERHGIDVWDTSEDVLNADPEVIKMINSGDIVGVFQVEGSGYTHLINEFEMTEFYDLVVSNALVRPGSWGTQGESYLARKQGREKVEYPHPILEPILQDTYGKFIFEEQVMLMAVELAGFTWGKADRLRKIISKKKDPAEFEAYKADFFDGAMQHMEEYQVAALWDGVEKASTYMFNKSHAVAYSVMTYQTAWLKHHYPLEFMWATLYNESEQEKVTTYIFECERLGIEITAPDINKSNESFTIVGDNEISFGLSSVAKCGPAAIAEIMDKRPFESFEHFTNTITKAKVKSNLVENFEKIGAFESIGHVSEYDKEYYYGPILGWQVLLNKPSVFDSILETCADANEDKDFHIIRGVVRDTKRASHYFRVEIEDSTGTYSGFMSDKSQVVSKRDYVVALVGDNTIHYLEDFVEAESEGESDFAAFLHEMASSDSIFKDTWLLEQGVAAHPAHVCVGYIVSVNRFTTKKNQDMAYIYVFFPATGFAKLPVFSYQLNSALALELQPFSWKVMMLNEGRSGGWVPSKMIDIDGYAEKKGIDRSQVS